MVITHSRSFAMVSNSAPKEALMMDTSKPFKPLVSFKKGYFMKGALIMKGALMRNIVLTLIIGLSALTWAQGSLTVRFNDTGFNYYGGEDDTRTGYIHLGLQEGALTVTLSDASSALKIEYPEIKQATDSKGVKKTWTKSNLVNHVKINSFSDGIKKGVTVLHNESHLNDIMSAYDEALTQLGFSATPEASYPNTKVSVYKNDSGAIRVIFTRLGRQVTVRMTTL
jgi:hypothetical protein